MSGVEVIVAQQTPEWHKFRRTGGPGNPYPVALGASDVATLMAGTRRDRELLYLEKAGVVAPQEANYPMQRGHSLEPEIREIYASDMGLKGEPATFYDNLHPWLFASLDFITDENDLIAEIKLMNRADHEQIRETGHGPVRYRWQCMAQLQVVRQARVCFLVAGLWGDPQNIVTEMVEPDEDDFNKILAAAERFLKGVTAGDRAYALGDSDTLQHDPDVGRLPEASIVEHSFPVTPARLALTARLMVRDIISEFTESRDAALAKIAEVKPVDGKTAESASQALKDTTRVVRLVKEKLTDLRQHFTKPADAISVEIEAWLKPIVDAKDTLKQDLSTYIELALDERDQREQEAAKLAADLRKAGHDELAIQGAVDLAMLQGPALPLPSDVSSWREPVIEVTEPEAVPEQFKIPDNAAIVKLAKSHWKDAKASGWTEAEFIEHMERRMPGVKVTFQRRAQSS